MSQTETPNQTEEFVPPTVEPPKYEPKFLKDDNPHRFVPPCPGPNDQRVGQYASEFKARTCYWA